MKGKLLFLGTGGSMGVPVIGCGCAVCHSHDPCNQRLRTSALITVGGRRLLIDAGPDFREQALEHKIDHLDGVLLTHAHYDHIGGLDELRTFYFISGQPLPCLLSRATFDEVRLRHAHLFEEPDEEKNLTAQLDFEILDHERGETTFADLPIRFLTYWQGPTQVTGFRIGDLAYLSDLKRYPDVIFEDLQELDTLVVSALRDTPSHVHLSVDEAVEFAQKVGAKETLFVHMAHELDHQKTNARLPDGMALAYDGLSVPMEVTS